MIMMMTNMMAKMTMNPQTRCKLKTRREALMLCLGFSGFKHIKHDPKP